MRREGEGRDLWGGRLNAKLTPFVPGGFFDVGTIIGLYRIQREHRDLNGFGRIGALRSAIIIDWLAWRRAREAQREDAHADD